MRERKYSSDLCLINSYSLFESPESDALLAVTQHVQSKSDYSLPVAKAWTIYVQARQFVALPAVLHGESDLESWDCSGPR